MIGHNENHPRYKGRRIIKGYFHLYKPNHPNSRKDGYIAEHRYKISKKLGRPLKNNELIHHKNNIRTDNRISNLELADKIEHNRNHRIQEATKRTRASSGRFV